MNMYPRRNNYYSQLPPTWRNRIAALRLLTSYGASVHEIARDRAISTLNVCRNTPHHQPEEDIFDFFAILHGESYCDFNSIDKQGWCALLSAIRSNRNPVKALKFLKSVGVDFKRIMHNGRTVLHWAAEMAHDVAVMDMVFSEVGPEYLNRQDRWGWTPLHYAVVAEYHRRQRVSIDEQQFAKAKFLLGKGADESVKANCQELLYGYRMLSDKFTPLELSKALKSDVYEGFINVLKAAGQSVDTVTDEEEDVFHDALEELSISDTVRIVS